MTAQHRVLTGFLIWKVFPDLSAILNAPQVLSESREADEVFCHSLLLNMTKLTSLFSDFCILYTDF